MEVGFPSLILHPFVFLQLKLLPRTADVNCRDFFVPGTSLGPKRNLVGSLLNATVTKGRGHVCLVLKRLTQGQAYSSRSVTNVKYACAVLKHTPHFFHLQSK